MESQTDNALGRVSVHTMSVRQRGGQANKKAVMASPESTMDEFDGLQPQKSGVTSEWDYKIALFLITAVAFVTRFWGISHPNEVVFDEVHFGKVP